MKKFSQPTIVVVALMLLLAACGPSAEEIAATETKEAANTAKAQTAAAPTATLTPTPLPTPTPTPLPTPTPTPLPDPDANAMIDWQSLNLPSTYTSLDPYDFGFGMGELIMWAEPEGGSRVDYLIENSFIFSKEWPEAAYGWTVLFPTETDRAVLDWYIDNFADQLGGIITNVFQANMISLIDDSEYSDLGDNSAEAWAIYEYGGTWWVFWGSAFRIGDIGGFVFLRHSFGDEPFIFIGDLAQTYAQSIETPFYSCRLESVFWDPDFDIPAYQYVAQGFYPGEPLIIALTGDVIMDGEVQGVTIVDDETDSADKNGEFYGRVMFLVDLLEVEVEEIVPSEFELMIIGNFSGCQVTYSSFWPPENE